MINFNRKQKRQKAAEERQEKRGKLTDAQQLALLDKMGHRAVKERAKLQARIEKSNSNS